LPDQRLEIRAKCAVGVKTPARTGTPRLAILLRCPRSLSSREMKKTVTPSERAVENLQRRFERRILAAQIPGMPAQSGGQQ
jgi:hypothetical protein